MRVRMKAGMIAAGFGAILAAQAAQFEAASVKPNKSGEPNARMDTQPGGRFVATNVPLRVLILTAYQLLDPQLTGGPSWVDTDRFDITANGDGEFPRLGRQEAEPTPFHLMLRALLSERFRLVLRERVARGSTYALVLAGKDRKLGSRFQPSTTDCPARMAALRAGQSPAPAPAGFPVACGLRVNPTDIAGGDITV